MKDYSNALVEVDTILGHLNKEEFLKIPPIVINAIRQNKNSNYEFYFDNNVELKNQNMLPETKAILFNIFRDYLSTPEQKAKIIKLQAEERRKNEEIKGTTLYGVASPFVSSFFVIFVIFCSIGCRVCRYIPSISGPRWSVPRTVRDILKCTVPKPKMPAGT